MKLWSENIGGNLHEASEAISRVGFWVNWEQIVAMNNCGSQSTTVVFVVTDEEYDRLKSKYRVKSKCPN